MFEGSFDLGALAEHLANFFKAMLDLLDKIMKAFGGDEEEKG